MSAGRCPTTMRPRPRRWAGAWPRPERCCRQADLRGLPRDLAVTHGQPVHRLPERRPEIRRLPDADRAAALAELRAAARRRGRCVASLKRQPGPDLAEIGSGELVAALLGAALWT